MVDINPQTIKGNWRSGIALDFHTTRSIPIGTNEYGHMQFETERPAIAELLYQLKYKGKTEAAQEIINTAGNLLLKHRSKFDILVPVPPSTPRAVQPVMVLAQGIGALINLPVIDCINATRPTRQLKEVTDPEERQNLLNGLYTVDAKSTSGKNVLLFDDLFRSGSTMNAITSVLVQQGKAANVYAFTITKTRSNK